jgi:hypothetical protein
MVEYPTMWRKYERLLICLIIVVYIVLAAAMARVRAPDADEGSFGNAAVVFGTKHILAMPMRNRVWLPGLDSHLYVTAPLYFVGLSLWFKLFGAAIVTMRYFSVFWGVVGLIAWYFIVNALTKNRGVALLSMALIALNYDYINLTSERYDPMVAALNAAGMAVYIVLRERNFPVAVFISNVLVAAAFVTHPYGLFGFAGLALLCLSLDRQKLSVKVLALAATPYVLALAGWGTYIAQEPRLFWTQFHGNASGRLSHLFSPWTAFVAEIHDRYIVLFGGWRPGVPVYMKIKTLILITIFVSICGCLLSAEIRRVRGHRIILSLTGLWFLMLMLLEGTKLYNYLLLIWPIYFVIVAIWLESLIRKGGWLRYASIVGICLLVIFAITSIGYRARLNSYQNAFLPALRYLQENVKGNDLVVGSGSFGFGLDFEKHVLDDHQLGYSVGEVPEYIVIDKQYSDQINASRRPKPDLYRYVQNMLSSRYQIVFSDHSGPDFYRIYRKVN